MIPQFGALLLELITGQSLAKESADVIQWIQELRSNLSMHNMIDPDLGNSYSSKELWDLLSVARLCMKVQNTQAFSISQIFWYLQKRFGNNWTTTQCWTFCETQFISVSHSRLSIWSNHIPVPRHISIVEQYMHKLAFDKKYLSYFT